MLAELNAARVHQLRTARDLTQKDLADAAGIPTAKLSRILSGSGYAAPADLICSIATALGCDERLLGRSVPEFLYTRPWLRAYADAPKKTVDQVVNDTLVAVEAFDSLQLKRLPDRLPSYPGDLNDASGIDEFAGHVREAADISTPHVPNVTRAAERLGCIILPMDSELGKHLGMSMYVNGRPIVRVARPGHSIPGDRQRFTTSHELGHLTLHATCPPPDSAVEAREVELQAHRFASAFLLPADEFLADLDQAGGRVTLTTLSKLKARWGVAIKAMVVRLQQLNRIDSEQARSLYKQISARGWNKSEPIEVENEQALWLDQALVRRFSENTAAEAAAHTGLNVEMFDNWVSWSPEDAMVIKFPARPCRG